MTVCILGAADTMPRLAHARVEATFQGMRRILFTVLVMLPACGAEAPPVLTVGAVAYHEPQLLGLTESRRRMLAHISAFGQAVADSTLEELGAPLLRRWRDDWLLETLAAELTLEANGVGDDVLRAHYLTDPEYELTVRHILFFSERWRTDEERGAAKAKAERALDAIRRGADFAETAATLSEEPGAEGRQGLLTPGRKGAWVDEFWTAASALEPGEISPVTETQYGYHILRLEDRRVVPFEEARPRVAREVADRIEDSRRVLDRWVEERSAAIVLREQAIARLAQAAAEASDTLAVLPGNEALTTADFGLWAAAQPASWAGGAASGAVDGTGAAVLGVARRRIALAEASRRRLVVPDAERARLRRRWDDLAYRWSASLGFVPGMSVSAVSAAALQALGDPAQGAAIVRDELAERAPLLEHAYEIVMAEPGA